MDLGPQPELRSDRLWLSAFVTGDVQAVFDYAKNPQVARHTTWKPHQSLADAEGFIDMVRGYEDGFCWAIRLAPDGPARGAVEFCLSDSSNGSVHYVLAEELWNRGLMTEAVTTVLQWAFETFDSLERVKTTTTSANTGSRRVLEKCGFEFTGTVVEKWAKSSEPVELATYELSRERWVTRPGA
jgi:ribosomal-protein-alanine N-acetyltransferase